MTPPTDYGKWTDYDGGSAPTVRDVVIDFVGDDVAHYNTEALAEGYRAMIESALPAHVRFDGERFTSSEPHAPAARFASFRKGHLGAEFFTGGSAVSASRCSRRRHRRPVATEAVAGTVPSVQHRLHSRQPDHRRVVG